MRTHASRGLADSFGPGGTTHINVVDGQRAGVSLIISNAADFGSHLVLADHGIFLHNRGMGFSLEPGHPAEYTPGRRPPHTLSPLLITDSLTRLDTVLGTMGGDARLQAFWRDQRRAVGMFVQDGGPVESCLPCRLD